MSTAPCLLALTTILLLATESTRYLQSSDLLADRDAFDDDLDTQLDIRDLLKDDAFSLFARDELVEDIAKLYTRDLDPFDNDMLSAHSLATRDTYLVGFMDGLHTRELETRDIDTQDFATRGLESIDLEARDAQGDTKQKVIKANRCEAKLETLSKKAENAAFKDPQAEPERIVSILQKLLRDLNETRACHGLPHEGRAKSMQLTKIVKKDLEAWKERLRDRGEGEKQGEGEG